MTDRSSTDTCSVTEVTLPRGIRAVRLENDLLAATILPDKGADVYELIYRPKGIDVLWKSPWGLRRPNPQPPIANTEVAWLDVYEGGWQELFPNGGNPCTYKGIELTFHGEASLSSWDWEVVEDGGASAAIRLSLRLARSPFLIERTMRVESGQPNVGLRERVTNEAGEPMDYMWSHHPAFGAPFLGPDCRIDTNARTLIADDLYDPPDNPLTLGSRYGWPTVERDGAVADLSRVPGPERGRAMLGYFTDYEGDAAWYGITNADLGFGVGLVWPTTDFPHAWLWQEMHATPGYSWYKGVYVMAIEPATTIPGQGLVTAMEKTGTHRTLAPGESAEAELRAVFYDGDQGIVGIAADGAVTIRES